MRMLRRVACTAIVSYGSLTMAIWWYFLAQADASAIGMLLAFGPRWVLIVPWVLFVPLAFLLSTRWRIAAAICAAVTVFGIAQFELPALRRGPSGGPAIRVVTYNTDGSADLADRIRGDVRRWDADVAVMQDCKTNLRDTLRAMQSPTLHPGRAFCMVSKWPLLRVDSLFANRTNRAIAFRYDLQLPSGTLTVVSVHLSSPRTELWAARHLDFSKLPQSIATRSAESLDLAMWVGTPTGPTIVAGDFNAPYGSRILRDTWGAWTNAFASVGTGLGHTMYAGRYAVRIDHLLANARLEPVRVEVGDTVPSEHRPVLGEWRLRGGR